MNVIILLLLGGLSLSLVGLLKALTHVSRRELKTRAREGDKLAAKIYRASAYGDTMAMLLWLAIVFSSAVFLWALSQSLTWLGAIPLGALFIWLAYVWLPPRKVSDMTLQAAGFVAPYLGWIAEHTHIFLDPVNEFIQKRWPASTHTGVYDLNDILQILQEQSSQSDSRVDPATLNIAVHAVTFGRKLVSEAMTPMRQVRMLPRDEAVGPVLMAELHESGFEHFPVYGESQSDVVGVLSLSDMVNAKATGLVKDHMNSQVEYLLDDQFLSKALDKIFDTKQHYFLVKNEFEEFVGVISSEDVLRQILGPPLNDDFDRYEELVDPSQTPEGDSTDTAMETPVTPTEDETVVVE